MDDNTASWVRLRDVDRELRQAAAAVERADYAGALGAMTTARRYLDELPTAGADEHLFAAFVAADKHLADAQASLDHAGVDRRRLTERSLRALQSVSNQLAG